MPAAAERCSASCFVCGGVPRLRLCTSTRIRGAHRSGKRVCEVEKWSRQTACSRPATPWSARLGVAHVCPAGVEYVEIIAELRPALAYEQFVERSFARYRACYVNAKCRNLSAHSDREAARGRILHASNSNRAATSPPPQPVLALSAAPRKRLLTERSNPTEPLRPRDESLPSCTSTENSRFVLKAVVRTRSPASPKYRIGCDIRTRYLRASHRYLVSVGRHSDPLARAGAGLGAVKTGPHRAIRCDRVGADRRSGRRMSRCRRR